MEVNSRATLKSCSIQHALKEAIEEGYRDILIEAGPSLLAEALQLQLIDELFLTVVQSSETSVENKVDINELTRGYVEIQRIESQNLEVKESYLTFHPINASQGI